MATRHRNQPQPQTPPPQPYNIIPLNNLLQDHPSLRFPELRAATSALRAVGDIRKPPYTPWLPHYDLLDWLGIFFGFQKDNINNQREHIVLHLTNRQMQLQPPPENIDTLSPSVLRRFRRKVLSNYTRWCDYLNVKPNVWLKKEYSVKSREYSVSEGESRRELLYVGLYLLIWGESANLRFMPECICYIFHNMCGELNKMLEDYIDEQTGRPILPSFSGENAFLDRVVKPIYETVRGEVEKSRNGSMPHSTWRNYDDLNEYFWSRRCFEKLKWPINLGSNFFVTSDKVVGKTGFVEQRSFLNVFRSFDKLWIMLVLFLQAAIVVAWKERGYYPWEALGDRDIQVKLLSVFITWSVLRFVKAILDGVMQFKLVSRETLWLGVRMLLKVSTDVVW